MFLGFPWQSVSGGRFPVFRDKHTGLLKAVKRSMCMFMSKPNWVLKWSGITRQSQKKHHIYILKWSRSCSNEMSDQDECSSKAPRAPLKLFRYMAEGKLYTSGNSHVISTVREQTVEQRASKLAKRDTSLRLELQWSRTCKNPPRNGNSTHDCPRLQGLCGGYSQILRMSLNHILQDSYWTQTEL